MPDNCTLHHRYFDAGYDCSDYPDFLEEILVDTGEAMKTQVGGDHYKKLNIQPVDYILENNLGYLEGNAVKYLTRHRDKNGAEDVKKAIHYCEMILEKHYAVSKEAS